MFLNVTSFTIQITLLFKEIYGRSDVIINKIAPSDFVRLYGCGISHIATKNADFSLFV